MKTFFQDLVQDTKHDARAFAQNRAALIVANLVLLPWFVVIVTGRNLDAWQPLLEVFGILFVYWFFTRRQASEMLPVRQPIIESALALALVLVWMLFRIGQYASMYDLPEFSVAAIPDVYETIVPKIIEMVILPLALWTAMGYRRRELGLRFGWRAWIPALAPMAVLIYLGLQNNKPAEWWDSLIYFFLGAGLPEEFLFRGLLQSRFEALLKNPTWAIYLAALVFGASHLPINLGSARPENWISAFESAFTFQLSVGFALGYAFYRARSLPPLMVIHTLINAAP